MQIFVPWSRQQFKQQWKQQISWLSSKWKLLIKKKFKTSDFSQDTMKKKMKRQPTEWDKIFVSHASDNRFVSRLHREIYLRVNNRHIIQLKWAEDYILLQQSFLDTRHLAFQVWGQTLCFIAFCSASPYRRRGKKHWLPEETYASITALTLS